MRNKEKIERLERRMEFLENREKVLKADLINRRIFTRERIWHSFESLSIPSVPAISLEELKTMQSLIINYLNVELKTTEAKTELVKKEK